MNLKDGTKRFRLNMVIFLIEAILPFALLFTLQRGEMLLSGMIFTVLVLGIIYLVVFR